MATNLFVIALQLTNHNNASQLECRLRAAAEDRGNVPDVNCISGLKVAYDDAYKGENEMKRRIAAMLVVACIVLLAAAFTALAQSAPRLEVSDFQSQYVRTWSPNKRDPSSDVNYQPASFELSAVFRNTGAKVITSVSWECLFFKDAQQTKVMLRHKFRDGKRIAPGEEARLKRASQRGAATEYKAVRITRVVYADGTVWQATKAGS